jgi:hypothetical protein
MRELVILGRRHGAKEKEIVSGPETPFYVQKELFRNEFLMSRNHPDYELAELAWLDVERSARLAKGDKPAPAPVAQPETPAPAEAKQEAPKSRKQKSSDQQ